ALEAFLGGNAALLLPQDVPTAIRKLELASYNGTMSEERLQHSVRKILKAKYKAGLNNFAPISARNLSEDLDTLQARLHHEDGVENSITVVKNDLDLVPIRNLDIKEIAYVKLGDDNGGDFLKMLKKYTRVNEISGSTLDTLLTNLEPYNLVIVGYHKSNANPWKDHNFTDKELVWLYELARKKNIILDVFAKP